MSKKFITILVALAVAAIGLSGCGSKASDKQTDGADNSAEEEYDLVIASHYNEKVDSHIGDEFAKEHNLKIKYIDYVGDENLNALDVLLMAQDTEVDIFYANVLDVAKYVRMSYYEDLKQYDSLKSKIESNSFIDFLSNYDGKCFGVPVCPRYNEKDMFMFASPDFLTYCFENIDGFAGTYADPDGEKLYELFKHLYENDGDKVEFPLEEVDYNVASCSGYVMMSPFSEHKETAALYLDFAYDHYKDNVIRPYPDLGDIDFDNTYLTWRSTHYQVCSPLYDAKNKELMKTDGSEKALRKLAKETAKHVRMMLEG